MSVERMQLGFRGTRADGDMNATLLEEELNNLKEWNYKNNSIMKFLKNGFPLLVSNPKVLFDEKARNIKFHFDLMHGRNNLDKAIDLLNNQSINKRQPDDGVCCRIPNEKRQFRGFSWLRKPKHPP